MQTHSKLDIVDEKYQRTLVYGIICMITGKIYVGSTHQTLEERIAGHIRQRDCSAWQILERGNYKAYEIQKWPCNTLREALTLEGGWQRAYKASFRDFLVNERIEGAFKEESPEARQEYGKQYREEHKEETRVRDKKYREEHKEELQAYDKQYREEHKEEKKARNKKYHENHKEEKDARRKQPWTCEYCNKKMTTGAKYNHKKLYCKNKPSE
jgi:hypothetical protein